MTDIEKRFNADMRSIYETAKSEYGYNATRFLQMLSKYGGIATAKKLITGSGISEGLFVLYEHGRLDISVEAHVLKPEYKDLFSEDERRLCKEKLNALKK